MWLKKPDGLNLIFFLLDIQQSRLDLAKEFGADGVVLIDTNSNVMDTTKKIIDLMGDCPDKAVDCSGAEFSVLLSIHVSVLNDILILLPLKNCI